MMRIAMVLVLFAGLTVEAMCLGSSEGRPGYLTQLRSADPKEREEGARAISGQQKALVAELVALASEDVERLHPEVPNSAYPWRDSKHLSILLLGELRAVEAVPVLIEDIGYKNPRSIVATEPLDKDGWYPAVEALSKIGMPAIEPIIKKLGGYDEECLGRELCCWVIKKVLGPRLGRVRLEIAIEESKKPEVKKNLQAAVNKYFPAREAEEK